MLTATYAAAAYAEVVGHEAALKHEAIVRVRGGHGAEHQSQELGLGEVFHIHDLALREERHQGKSAEGSLLRDPRHGMGT